MTISTKIAAGSFANNFGYADLPNKSACLGYYLFGVDQASSIANRVNPAAPLAVNGSPTYEPNCVRLDGNTGIGFSTPFNGAAYNRTCIVIVTDDYENVTGVGVPTKCFFDGGVAFLSWNSNAQFFRWGGSQILWRQGAQDVLGPRAYTAGIGAHWIFPSGKERRTAFKTMIATENATDLRASVTRLGLGGNSANTRYRMAAFAQFTALTDAQALASAAFMQADITARGIDNMSPLPTASV
jgi:hypothetical protein